jgi:hypothetical protein
MTGMAGHDPGISGHVRPESLVTLLRNTHQVELDAIADEINNRPRKGLGVRSPLSVYRELLANSQQHSTLIH